MEGGGGASSSAADGGGDAVMHEGPEEQPEGPPDFGPGGNAEFPVSALNAPHLESFVLVADDPPVSKTWSEVMETKPLDMDHVRRLIKLDATDERLIKESAILQIQSLTISLYGPSARDMEITDNELKSAITFTRPAVLQQKAAFLVEGGFGSVAEKHWRHRNYVGGRIAAQDHIDDRMRSIPYVIVNFLAPINIPSPSFVPRPRSATMAADAQLEQEQQPVVLTMEQRLAALENSTNRGRETGLGPNPAGPPATYPVPAQPAVAPNGKVASFYMDVSRVVRRPEPYDPAKASTRPITVVLDQYCTYMRQVCQSSDKNTWIEYVSSQAFPFPMFKEWEAAKVVAERHMQLLGGTMTWQFFEDWARKFLVGNPKEERYQLLMNIKQKAGESFTPYVTRWDEAFRNFSLVMGEEDTGMTDFSKLVMIKGGLNASWLSRVQNSIEAIVTTMDLRRICTNMERNQTILAQGANPVSGENGKPRGTGKPQWYGAKNFRHAKMLSLANPTGGGGNRPKRAWKSAGNASKRVRFAPTPDTVAQQIERALRSGTLHAPDIDWPEHRARENSHRCTICGGGNHLRNVCKHLPEVGSLLVKFNDSLTDLAVAVNSVLMEPDAQQLGEISAFLAEQEQELIEYDVPWNTHNPFKHCSPFGGKHKLKVLHVKAKGLQATVDGAVSNLTGFDRSLSGGAIPGRDERRREPVSFLVDTGAGSNFMSPALAKSLRLPVQKSSRVVQLADGKVTRTLGMVHALTTVQGYEEALWYNVMPLPDEFGAILGVNWCVNQSASLHFRKDHGLASIHLRKTNSTLHVSASLVQNTDHVDVVSNKHSFGKVNCSHVNLAELKDHVDDGDALFFVRVTAFGQVDLMVSDPDPSLADPERPMSADMQKLVEEFKDVFPSELPAGLPPDRGNFHTIPLVDGARPPFGPMYRLSPAERREVEKQIKDLLDKGFIKPSASPYGAPVLFVAKKDGSLRMVIDYRALNNLTVKNKYPLPRIDDLFDQLAGAQVFTSLDLMSGYHQIRLKPEDCDKTAFRTPLGLYQFEVLSFGLANAPATFQAVMNDVFNDLLGKFVLVYMDDILVFSSTKAQHLGHVRAVLQTLREKKLFAKLSKCAFEKPELNFLGFLVSRDGIKIDPAKAVIVEQWPRPQTIQDVQRFVGLCNYFKKFIQGYGELAAPLTNLLKKDALDVVQAWPEACQKAFEGLKLAITSAPVLCLPDFTKPFEVVCDASGVGIGAVLLQEGHPICFYGRKMKQAELNWKGGVWENEFNFTVTEQEMLAVVDALRQWRCYLEGVQFIVVTDHKPITFFNSQKTLSRRQTRWFEFMSRFDYTWEYRPGRLNVADPLSRHPLFAAAVLYCDCFESVHAVQTRRGSRQQQTNEQPSAQPVERPAEQPVGRQPSAQPVAPPAEHPVGRHTEHSADSAAEQETDSEQASLLARRPLLQKVLSGYQHDPWFADSTHTVALKQRDGLYWKVNAEGGEMLVVPDDAEIKQQLMREVHDSEYSGHPGIKRTFVNLSRYYWFPGMQKFVTDYVRGCASCQRSKASTQKPAGLLRPLPIPRDKWDDISMDLIVGLPLSEQGNDAMIVFVDRLSKMMHAAPCKSGVNSAGIAALLSRTVIANHGFPCSIVCDRDPKFTSAEFRSFCKEAQCSLKFTTAYHPETDGQTERMNKVVVETLRNYISPTQTDWEDRLPMVECAINGSWNESIQNTPFYLNYGKHPRLPYSLTKNQVISEPLDKFVERMQQSIQFARACLMNAQARQKHYADQKRKELEFAVGTFVWLSTRNLRLQAIGSRKFLPRYVGPFPVVQRIGDVAYSLALPPNMRMHPVFHVSLLKAYKDNGVAPSPPVPLIIDGDEYWEVEKILAHRPLHRRNGRHEYLVKWKGFGPEHNWWQKESDMMPQYAEELHEYWELVESTTSTSRRRKVLGRPYGKKK